MNRLDRVVGLATAAVVAGVLSCLAAGPASASAAHRSPFDGVWESIDVDASHQTLTVRGSGRGTRSVTLFDESASVCGGAPARLSGPGVVSGASMVVTGPLICRPGGNPFGGTISVAWSYDAGNDTLTDEFGVVWHRSGLRRAVG